MAIFNKKLPESENFPPDAADTNPDDHVDDRGAKTEFPPGSLVYVTGAEKNRRSASGVVRETAAKIGKESEA